MRIATVLLLACCLLAMPACQMNERLSGTTMGAGGGLLLGALAAGTVAGGLIGGVAGGLVGYLIGDYLADQRERGTRANPLAPCPQQCPQQCAQPCPQQCAQPCPQPAPQYTYPQQQYCPPAPCQPAPCPPAACAPAGYGQGGYYGQPRVGGARAANQAWRASEDAIARGKRATTLPEAEAAYREAIRLDPRNANAWNALGLARLTAGDRSGAEQALRHALTLDPGHHAAGRNLAWATSGIR